MEKYGPAIRLIGAAFYIGLCIMLGILGGVWLDNKLSTQPIFVLIGLILGLVLGFWGLYQMVMPLIKENSNQSKKRERR